MFKTVRRCIAIAWNSSQKLYCDLGVITLQKYCLENKLLIQRKQTTPRVVFLWFFGLSPNSKHSHATFIPLLQGSPGYVVMTTITGASTLFSLYGTIVIVRAATPFLKQYRISMKFASFQLVLVLMNIQNLVFSILARYDLPSCIGSRGPEVRGSSRWILLLYFRAF